MPSLDALFQTIPPRKGLLLAIGLSQVGLIWAPALLSVSMGFIFIWGVLCWIAGLWEPQRHAMATRYALLALSVLFLLILFWVWGLEDVDYWLTRIRIKLPFLLVPAGLLCLPPLRKKDLSRVHTFLLLLLVILSFQIGIRYLFDFEAINEILKQGQHMPMPGNHIRLSLLMAYGVVSGLTLYRSLPKEDRLWKNGVLISTLFLGVFLHVLSVRSGLAGLYAGLLVVLIHEVLVQRKWKGAVLGAILIILAPLIAYQTVPSFRNKVNYVKWEIWMQQQGQASGQLSDAGRWMSWQIGWSIWKDHPLLGVGPGNVKQEVYRKYAAEYPNVQKKRMPHNQYLSVGAGMGVIGLLIFMTAFLWALRYRKFWFNSELIAFYTIILVSGLVENTLENSEGVGLAVWWLGIHFVCETGK